MAALALGKFLYSSCYRDYIAHKAHSFHFLSLCRNNSADQLIITQTKAGTSSASCAVTLGRWQHPRAPDS